MAIDSIYTIKQLETASRDPYRLGYHFMPPAGWMNDPNGLVKAGDTYHLFYQCNPLQPHPGLMCWGHAVSSDMIHWEHRPLALLPEELDTQGDTQDNEFATGGCFSGSAVTDGRKLYIMYTECHPEGEELNQTQWMAHSDRKNQFRRAEKPCIAHYPQEGSMHFRDPKMWKHGKMWYSVIGSCHDGLGNALLYRSANLSDWEYMGEMLRAESAETQGYMWECPNVMTIGDTDILLVSPMGLDKQEIYTAYFIGKLDYETGKFKAERFERLCGSREYYAPQIFYTADTEKLPVGIAWMQHWSVGRYPTVAYGWSGAMSLPCEFYLNEGRRLCARPVKTLKSLRTDNFINWQYRAAGSSMLSMRTGKLFELNLELLLPEEGGSVHLKVRCSEEGEEYTEICLDSQSGDVLVDCSRMNGLVSRGQINGLGEKRGLRIQLLSDSSSLELFFNDGELFFAQRIFPKRNGERLELSLPAGSILTRLEGFHLAKIV